MTPELQAQADAAKAKAAEDKNKTTEKKAVVEPVKKVEVDNTLDVKPEVKTPVTVKPVGNTSIDSVGKLLADKGLENAQSIMDEFSKDGTLSINTQAALVDGLGESVANLVVNQLNSAAETLTAQRTALASENAEYANKKFNGKDVETTWAQMKEFAQSEESGLTTDDRKAMNKLLAKGGLQAQLVIDKIHSIYTNLDTTSTPADLLSGDVYSTGTFEVLTKSEYTAQMNKVVAEFGYDSPQAKELRNKREASRQRGL